MTSKEFLNNLANREKDILQEMLDILAERESRYCVIGGLAVNAYAEPVVSLDLDIVVAADGVEQICRTAAAKGLKIERFEHSVNLSSIESDLRIQIQTDPRYQSFIAKAVQKIVLGYSMNVAALEDVLQGKIWAYSDQQRRKSKRQKDLADIIRLVESYPELEGRLPPEIRNIFQ